MILNKVGISLSLSPLIYLFSFFLSLSLLSPLALQSLQMMMECVQDSDLHGLIAMSAQLAFEVHVCTL